MTLVGLRVSPIQLLLVFVPVTLFLEFVTPERQVAIFITSWV